MKNLLVALMTLSLFAFNLPSIKPALCMKSNSLIENGTSQGILKPIDDVFNKNYIKKTMIKVVDWQLKNPKHVLTDWTNGAFYTGVMAAYETTKSPKILDSLMSMGNRNKWQPHTRFDHADDIVISQTYIDLYRLKKDKKMIQASLDSIQKLSKMKGNEATKHDITWWWCDALFMAPPTLAKLSKY